MVKQFCSRHKLFQQEEKATEVLLFPSTVLTSSLCDYLPLSYTHSMFPQGNVHWGRLQLDLFMTCLLIYPGCLYFFSDSSLCMTRTFISQPVHNMSGISYISLISTHPNLKSPIICEALRSKTQVCLWLVYVFGQRIYNCLLTVSLSKCLWKGTARL